MAVIETWFNQDLQKPVKTQYIDGSLFSNNGNGNRIGVVVTDNGEPVTISGTVSGYVVISNGSTVPCTGAKSGNRASILIPPAAYVPGSAFISLFVTDGTTVTTLAALSTTVLQTRTESQVDPGSVVTDWTQTINGAMQDVQTAAANLGSIVAIPYASLTYPVPLGKYTYYDGGLYRCISPIASSETFAPAHWTAVKLGDDVSDLKTAIDSIVSDTQAIEFSTYTESKYITSYPGREGTLETDANYHVSTRAIVKPGEIVRAEGICCSGYKSIAWYDSSNTYKGILVTGTDNTTVYFTIPATAKYIRATAKTGDTVKFTYMSVFMSNEYNEFKEDVSDINGQLQELQTDFDNTIDRTISVGSRVDGQYITAYSGQEGTPISDNDSCYATNINVLPDTLVKIEGAYLVGNRSICGYASNKTTFVKVLATNTNETTVRIYIPSDVSYIKISGRTGVTPTVEYLDKFMFIRNHETYSLESGYLNNNGTSVISSASYYHSDYIEVVGRAYITFDKIATPLSNLLFVFDNKKNLIIKEEYESSGAELANYIYRLPINAKYVRINSYRTSVTITYPEQLQRNQFAVNYFKHVDRTLNGYITNLFQSSWNRPVITLIDDDTAGYNNIVLFKEFCDDIGIKGTWAVQTCNLFTDERTVPFMQAAEDEGFATILHCYEQDEKYNERIYSEIEADLCRAIRDMNRAGFINWKHWVTPGGYQDQQYVQFCEKFGFDSLITSGWQGNAYETIDVQYPYRRFRISRNEFSVALLDTLKATTLAQMTKNPWILLEMHMFMPECKTPEFKAAMQDYYNYTTARGFVWRTFPEEMARRMAVYKAFEMF